MNKCFKIRCLVFSVAAMLVLVENVCAEKSDWSLLSDLYATQTVAQATALYLQSKGEFFAAYLNDNFSRQEFDKQYKFYCVDDFVGSIAKNYSDIRQQYEAANRISNFDTKTAELEKIRQKLDNMCLARNDAICAEIKEKQGLYKKEMAKIESEWGKYKNYWIKRKQEEAAQAKQDSIAQEKRRKEQNEKKKKEKDERIDRVFSGNTIYFAEFYFDKITPKKKEFESTNDFNKRLNSFYQDSTKFYFKKFAKQEIIAKILTGNRVGDDESGYYCENIFIIEKEKYDTDKEKFYAKISAHCLEYGEHNGKYQSLNSLSSFLSVDIDFAVSPQEAKLLVEKGYTYEYGYDYFTCILDDQSYFYPSQVSITSKADTTKKYVIDVKKQESEDAIDIVFKGKYLWENNPKAADLIYDYKDLVVEIVAKIEEAAKVAKQKEEAARQEAEKVKFSKRLFECIKDDCYKTTDLKNRLLFEASGGDIYLFGLRRPFPNVSESYVINGKKVIFERNKKGGVICYVENKRTFVWELNKKGIVEYIGWGGVWGDYGNLKDDLENLYEIFKFPFSSGNNKGNIDYDDEEDFE